MQRHASSASRRRRTPEVPARDRLAAALRTLGREWRFRLATADASVHVRACRVRDELHAVANRVGRLLETPGARLAPIEIPSPTGGPDPGFVATAATLPLAAERLARLVDDLSTEQWQITGRIGDSTISVEELVVRPLPTAYDALRRHPSRERSA